MKIVQFDKLGNANWLRNVTIVMKVSLSALAKAQKPAPLPAWLRRVLVKVNLDGFAIEVADAVEPETRAAYKAAGMFAHTVLSTQGAPVSRFDVIDERAVEFAEKRAAWLVGKRVLPDGSYVTNPDAEYAITNSVRDSLRGIITRGTEKGLSVQQVAKEILDAEAFSDARAKNIARTELAFAHEQGALDEWRASGVVTGKRSILADTHPAADVCDEAADEGVIPLDALFESSGVQAPPHHPSCLCALVPEVEISVRKISLGPLTKAPAWDESLHPRDPAGTSTGGQFTSSSSSVLTPIDAASDEQKERAKKLKLPPAWRDVRISEDPNAALQATGVDSKGRTQYCYSAEHSERQAAEKFARLQEFARVVPKIEAAAVRDMRAGSDAAAATYLIAQTGFRIGSDAETGAAVKAYGATTLLGRHVQVDGDKVSFNFTGKKGVEISKTIQDKPLADFIRARGAGPDDRLFKTTDADVRTYMKNVSYKDFKVKDFRTYHGTAMAMQHIAEELKSPPTTIKAQKAAERRVAEKVAAHLGNTPTVARAAYIDPAVWGRLSVRQ